MPVGTEVSPGSFKSTKWSSVRLGRGDVESVFLLTDEPFVNLRVVIKCCIKLSLEDFAVLIAFCSVCLFVGSGSDVNPLRCEMGLSTVSRSEVESWICCFSVNAGGVGFGSLRFVAVTNWLGFPLCQVTECVFVAVSRISSLTADELKVGFFVLAGRVGLEMPFTIPVMTLLGCSCFIVCRSEVGCRLSFSLVEASMPWFVMCEFIAVCCGVSFSFLYSVDMSGVDMSGILGLWECCVDCFLCDG